MQYLRVLLFSCLKGGTDVKNKTQEVIEFSRWMFPAIIMSPVAFVIALIETILEGWFPWLF